MRYYLKNIGVSEGHTKQGFQERGDSKEMRCNRNYSPVNKIYFVITLTYCTKKIHHTEATWLTIRTLDSVTEEVYRQEGQGVVVSFRYGETYDCNICTTDLWLFSSAHDSAV